MTRGGVTYPVMCAEWDAPSEWHLSGLEIMELESTLEDRATEFPHTAGITTFLSHPDFPMDVRHNSKIAREKLAVWADKVLGPQWNGGPA